MNYDYIIQYNEVLNEKRFHLSCGYYSNTAFLFKKANFSVVINCNGDFTFYTVDGEKIETIQAKRMVSGRGLYEDILITTTDAFVTFKLPNYSWIDHYPDCDGESDRWSSKIIGINDEIIYECRK